VLDVVGSIVVHAVEVITSFDKRFFFRRELGKAIAELFAHGGGVVAEVNGICEPGDGKFDFSIACFDVFWVIRIPRICSIASLKLDFPFILRRAVHTIQSNSNLTAILWLKLLAIYLHSRAMSKQYVMPRNPTLPSTVSHLTL
jgi:hypothetical protein